MLIFYFTEYYKDACVADIIGSALSKYFSKEILYCHYSDGEPYLVGLDRFISVSHSHKMLVFAVSENIVGVDIEKNQHRDFNKISLKMGFDCSNLTDFYKQWTAYECHVKTKNIGLPINYILQFNGYTMALASKDKTIQLIDIKSII